MAKTDEQTRMSEPSKYPLKIIHAGFHRGATTSVAEALKILGLGPVWHTAAKGSILVKMKGINSWIYNDYDTKIRNNEDVNLDEWLQIIKCNVIMDAPVALYWDTFFDQYPNAKVILSVRDFDKWYHSVETSIFGIFWEQPYSFFTHILRLQHWLRHVYLQGLVDKLELRNKETARIKYFEKIEYVKKKVPSKQCLIYEVGSGWEPLCKFLGTNIPNQPFPRSNDPNSLKRKECEAIFIESMITLVVYGGISAAVIYGSLYGYRKYVKDSTFIKEYINKLM
eukprot:256626_1